MRQALNIYRAVKAYVTDGTKAGEMAKWRSEHEEAWMVVSEINELRQQYGR